MNRMRPSTTVTSSLASCVKLFHSWPARVASVVEIGAQQASYNQGSGRRANIAAGPTTALRQYCLPPGGSIMQPQWKPWTAQSRSTSLWLTGKANLRLPMGLGGNMPALQERQPERWRRRWPALKQGVGCLQGQVSNRNFVAHLVT